MHYRYIGVCCPEGEENNVPSAGGLPGSEVAGELPAIDPGLPVVNETVPDTGPGEPASPVSGTMIPTNTTRPDVRGECNFCKLLY